MRLTVHRSLNQVGLPVGEKPCWNSDPPKPQGGPSEVSQGCTVHLLAMVVRALRQVFVLKFAVGNLNIYVFIWPWNPTVICTAGSSYWYSELSALFFPDFGS